MDSLCTIQIVVFKIVYVSHPAQTTPENKMGNKFQSVWVVYLHYVISCFGEHNTSSGKPKPWIQR